MADQYVQLGGIAGHLGAQTVTTSGAYILTDSGYLSIGNTPSSAGTVRLANNFTVQAKTAGGTDRILLNFDAADMFNVGPAAGTTNISLWGGAGTNRWNATGVILIDNNAGITLRPKIILDNNGTAIQITTGAGTPEGVLTAVVGSLFLRSDGGAATTLYVKTSGTGNVGWTAK